ncbi:mucin-4-like [Physella acuta]|uniref:mucin-4-like n=1 Tax=Physella acuta TaxID=109671 RepID=UPI0027DB9890|nr:mucin-4-like [Physella acuta]
MEEGVNTGHCRPKIAGHLKEEMDVFMFKKQIKQEMKPIHALRKSTRPRKQSQRMLDGAEDDESPPTKKPCKSFKINKHPDICKNGEPFKCSLCESPYINTSAAKAKKKLENEPIVKEVNGQLLELCVKCAIALNNTENKGPSPEEREMFEEEGKKFAQQLSEELGEPEAVRLYCSLYQTTKCGCIQLYINGTKAVKKRKNSFTTADMSNPEVVDRDLSLEPPDDQADRSRKANFLLSLLKTSKAKKKLDSQKSIKSKLKKLSSEEAVNNKKDLETFILANRTKLKCLGICERGCQKVLCYSNNFLHKKLAVTGSKPRLEKTKGGVAEGRVPDLDRLATISCCEITCSQIALKENSRVAKWREQAQMSQKDMWQVIAEMLSFTDCEGNGRKCCYKFISLVTGCCQTTIQKVYVKTRLAKGDSTKPDHGMKSHWKKQKAETAGLPAAKGMKSNVQTIESKSLQDAGTSSSGAGTPSIMASTVVTLEQRLPPVTGNLQPSSSNVSVVSAMSCFNQRLEEPNMPVSQEQRQVSGAALKDRFSTVSNDDEELYAHFSMFKHQVTEKRPELLELLNAIEDGLKNRKDSSSEMGPAQTFVPASLGSSAGSVQVSSLSSSTPGQSCVSSKVPQAVLLGSVLTTAHSDQRRQTMTVVSSNRLSSVETSVASQSPVLSHVAKQSPVVPHGHPRSAPVLKSPLAQGKTQTNAGSHFIKTLPALSPKVLTGKQVASPMGSNLTGNQVSNDQMQLTSKLCWNQVSTPTTQTKLTSVEKMDSLPHSDLLVSYLIPTSGGSQNLVQGQMSTHSGTNMSCSVVTSNSSTGQLTAQAPGLTQDTLSVFLPNETLNLQHPKVFPIDFNNTDNSSINYLLGASPAPGTNFIQVLAPQSLPDQGSLNTMDGSSQSKIQGNAAASQSQPPASTSQYSSLFDALADSPVRELAQQSLPEAQPKRSYLPEILVTSMNSTPAVSASSVLSNIADISTDGPSQSSTKTVASHLGSAQLTASSHSTSTAHKMSRTKEPPQVVIVNPYISGMETSDLSSILTTSQSSYSLPTSQLTSSFQANDNITLQLGTQQPHLSNLGNQQTLQLITSMSNPPQAANQSLTPFIQARANTNVLISQNMNAGNHSASVLNIAPGNPPPSNPSSNATLNITPGNSTQNNISANSVVNIATGNQTLAISQSNPTLTIPQSNPTFTIPQSNPTFTIPQTNPTLPQGTPSSDLTNMTLLSLGNQLYQLVPNTLTGQFQLIPLLCANTSATPVNQFVLNLPPGTTSSFQAVSDPVSTLSTDTTHQYQQGVTLVSPPFPSNQTASQGPRHVLPNSRSGVGSQQAEQQPSTGATFISNLGDANHNQLLVPVSSSEANTNSLVTLIPHQSGLLSSQFVPNQQQIMVSNIQDNANNPNQQLIQWTTPGQGQASLGVESGQGSANHVLFENQSVETQKLVSEFILSSLCQNSDRNLLLQQLAPVSTPNSSVTVSNLNHKQASSTHQNTVFKSTIDNKSKPVGCPTDGMLKPASCPASEMNQIHGSMSQLEVLLQRSDTSQANTIANQTNAWQLNVEATDNARKSYQQSSTNSSSVPSQPQLKANINPSMNANSQITKQGLTLSAGSSSLSSNTVNASNSRLLFDHLQKLPAKSSINYLQGNMHRENTQSHTGHQVRLRESPQSLSDQSRLTEQTHMDQQAMLRENTLSHTDQQVQDNKSTTQQSKATVLVQPQNVHIFMSPSSGSGKDEDKLCLQKVSEDKRSEVIPLLVAYLHGNPNVSCEVTPSQDFCSPGPSGTDMEGNQLRQAMGTNHGPSTVVTISTNQEFVESLGKGQSGVDSSYLTGEFPAGQNVSSSTSSSPSEDYTYQCSTSHAAQVVPASGHASSTLSQSLYTYTTASADATSSDRSCPAFIRATNTPTDAVGPPNITVMSPSRHGSSHMPRLRVDTCRTTSATFPLSDTVGVAMPNQSTKAGLQLISHASSNKSQSGMPVTSASFASVIGTPMSNPSSTNLTRVPATSQANVKVVGGSMPAHRNISVSVSSNSTQKPGSQLTLVSSSQATLPATPHSKASTNYITPKPSSTAASHATSAKILEERFKLNCNQTKPRNRPYTVLQLLQQQEKEQALASQGPTPSAASSVGTTSMPSQTSSASLPLYTTANVLSATQPIPTPAGPLTLVIPIPAASQVFTKDGSDNRALFGQISFNSSNPGVAILQPSLLQPSPTTQGSTLVLKKAISQPDTSNQPASHSTTASPAPLLTSKIGPDPLTLPKLSNSTAFTPTHSKSISGSTASTLTASKLAPKTLKLQTPTSIACNLAAQSSLPPFEANIKLIGQPQVSGNTSALNKKLNEKSLKLRPLPQSESQVQLSTNTNRPDFKPQDRKPGEDTHSRPGSVESTASTHSSQLDSPYPSKQHVLQLKRSQVNSTASEVNPSYYADNTPKVKVHLQDNGADTVQFFQIDQSNADAVYRSMEQFTHIPHHTKPTNTFPSNSTNALPINSNSLPTHLKTTNSLPTHLNITDHYKDKKSLPSQNPLLANILFESSQNISTGTQQTLSDAVVRMLSSHNKATLERASQGPFVHKNETPPSGPKVNPSLDQWSRGGQPSGSDTLQSPTNTLSRLLNAPVLENTPSRRIEKVINDIYKFPDDVEDTPNAVRYQSDQPDNMGSVHKKHGNQFDRSKANVPFTDDLCIDNASENSMFKHSKHGHEKIISPKTTTKINLKKVQFSDEIGNSSIPTEVNSLNMMHSAPYNSVSLASRNSSEDKVYKSDSRNTNFMYKEDHEELSLNQAVLKGTMSHRGGPKDSKLKALLSSKPDGTFALRYAEESLSESGVLISGVGFKKMNKDDACSGEYPKDLANTSNYVRSKFYSDQRDEELSSPVESASKHMLPSYPQDFASNSSFEILSPKGYSKLSGQRGKTLPNVVYMEDNSESGSHEDRYEMGKPTTFFRKDMEEAVERQNLERSQLLKSNFELAQQMNQNTEKGYAKFHSPYVEFHNYGDLNYGEINSASKDDASNDITPEYVEAFQKVNKDGRSHVEENKLFYKSRLDHLSPHEDGIHKKHLPSSGILKPSPLPECEPFKQVDGQRVRHPSGVKNIETDFSYLDSRHRSAGAHKSFGDLADGIRGRDPLVSFSSMSRHEADSSPQHERQRYPSAEFLALDSSRHRSTAQMFKFNDQDPPPYDISQRQRNPSSSSLKAFFLSDSEFPNFDGGNRSRNPSSSSLMKLEFIEHSFHPIRSRNPSGSSTRRSRPGSSSSDREFHMNNFDELPIFSDVMRTRSRNSSGESLEPTIDTIILDPNFQNYVRHKF